MIFKSSVFFVVLMMSVIALGQADHKLLRRIAVFPIAEANVANSEEAWWQMRENLTKDQRFFVASRRFMVNRGVFQPRKELKPADAIILGKILDAQALVVSFLEDRTVRMKVYEGENGTVLWEGNAELHPAVPINEQIIKTSIQLMSAFVLAIPYQGFQVMDELIAKAIFEEDGKKMAWVFVGANSKVNPGDGVQWVQIESQHNKPLFSSTGKVSVIAEGIVKNIRGDRVLVEIEKMRSPEDLKVDSLVRFPKEFQRLQELYANQDKGSSLSQEYLTGEMKEASQFSKDHNSTSTALAWILNIAGFILLAF